ncbi:MULTISPECIES: 2-isopropylmalate synthase [Marinobacter]|uniref:2-isopropylmalate synthase n=1 Tax=Marinobacter TaxID=2742 RepID=UPI001244EE3E|nr:MULTISPECIES: 2-isopropylmalate synthase [Marinobacter]MBL3557137.1 2-isopropylmalate synthase [Marinobacter sp. JB05H06]
MVMTEAERQYYLGKAGIHLWYARAPLPGAAPSPEFRFPEADDAPEADPELIVAPSSRSSTPNARTDGPGKDRIAGLQALMANTNSEVRKDSESVKPTEPANAGRAEAPASAPDRPLSGEIVPEPDTAAEPEPLGQVDAHLGIWISEHMVLVSGMSDEASERLQHTLAENILSSLGESVVAAPRHIRWPVFGNPRVPGNSVEDFRHTLRSMSKEFGARKLLLLGVMTDDMASGRAEWLAAALGVPAVDFPRSLAELSAVPAYKRELWQQLKAGLGV